MTQDKKWPKIRNDLGVVTLTLVCPSVGKLRSGSREDREVPSGKSVGKDGKVRKVSLGGQLAGKVGTEGRSWRSVGQEVWSGRSVEKGGQLVGKVGREGQSVGKFGWEGFLKNVCSLAMQSGYYWRREKCPHPSPPSNHSLYCNYFVVLTYRSPGIYISPNTLWNWPIGQPTYTYPSMFLCYWP